MEWILLKIATAVCCWWLLWTNKLTDPEGGLFDFAPNYYPFKKNRKLQLFLRCAVCLSGWTMFFIALLLLPLYFKVSWWIALVYAIGALPTASVYCILIDAITFHTLKK